MENTDPPNESSAPAAESSPPSSGTVAVACGCFGRRKNNRKLVNAKARAKNIQRKRFVSAFFWRSRYFDAQSGKNPDDYNFEEYGDDDWDQDSLFFFDAEQEPLGDGEYPVVFTNSLQRPKPMVSFQAPETLLRQPPTARAVSFAPAAAATTLPDPDRTPVKSNRRRQRPAAPPLATPPRKRPDIGVVPPTPESPSIKAIEEALQTPRVRSGARGYPGGLTMEELDQCHAFLEGLQEHPEIEDQVYSFRDIEEEPYTICRWLRATKFDATAILDRLRENNDLFRKAQADDFYPDVPTAIGAPAPVFLSQYPFLTVGNAKNGCPVNYFLAGRINPEGIFGITTIDRLQGYFWWSFMHKFRAEMRAAQEQDPDFVRLEGINVLDLSGLSSSALSGETLEVVKVASKISDFFPETLHCMLILNAPGFFSIFWGLIKKFIDPRTASRIQVFSNAEKGLAALRQLVETNQIPSDYGGTNKAIAKAFVDQSADPELLEQHAEVIHAKKRKGTARIKKEWTIPSEHEAMEVRVYTRSASSAEATVFLAGEPIQRVVVAGRPSRSTGEEPGEPVVLPTETIVVSGLEGPASVSVEVRDLDDADKQHTGLSRGYFLVVGNIKTTTKPEGSDGSPSEQ